ncbi:MAG: hypothetical protein JWN10_1157 [Solirubrobacterales bacterium]|nr:hypothetical protein [Solirubrobacterales bacterium]
MSRQLYRAYVDETGDRGWGGRSSPIFVVSAIIVPDGYETRLVEALDRINATLKKPAGTVLHWAENVKTHSQRKYVAGELAGLDMTVASVVVLKQPLTGSGTALSNPTSMYNYAIRRLMERISWFVDDAGGEVSVTFAHVKRFPYARLDEYMRVLRNRQSSIRWQAFTGKPKIDQPSRIRPLQIADLVAGAFGSALRVDDYGSHEASYLLQLVPRIYIRGGGKVTSYGFNPIGLPEHLTSYPWWPAFLAACSARRG